MYRDFLQFQRIVIFVIHFPIFIEVGIITPATTDIDPAATLEVRLSDGGTIEFCDFGGEPEEAASPAKSRAQSPAQSPAKSPAKSRAKSPAKSPAKLRANSPAKSRAAKSPAKSLAKSPAKSRAATSPAKSPAKSR